MWRDLVRSFQCVCYLYISRGGGFVALYVGEGVLAPEEAREEADEIEDEAKKKAKAVEEAAKKD